MALKADYGEKIRFIVVDVDDAQGSQLAADFRVNTIPAFFLIDQEGHIKYETVGTPLFSTLEQEINSILYRQKSTELSITQNFLGNTIPEAVQQASLLTLLIIFIGGLVTSFSPCIFSMIPLLVGYIGGFSQPTKTKGFFLSLLFVLGLSTTFSILGIIAALLGTIFGQLGSFFYIIMAFAAITMGLSLLEVLTFRIPGLKNLPFSKTGYIGAYFTGLFFGLVASPCATPVLAVVMTYVATQADLTYGAVLLFVYGLGHGIPLLIAGTFTAAIKSFTKIQRVTQYITYISGSLLIFVGLYFLFKGLV